VTFDVEELLAAELDRRASKVTWHPALLDGALARHRQQNLRRRAAVGAATISLAAAVLAVAVAVAAAISSGRAASSRPSVQTLAYVVNRVRSALGAAGAEILEVHSRLSNGWSYTAWVDPAAGNLRIDTNPPGGSPVRYYASGSQVAIVKYETKTYSSEQVDVYALGQPPGWILFSLLGVSATWGDLGGSIPSAAAIRHQLDVGKFRLAGAETVNGQRLLHLRGVGKLPELRPVGGGYRAIDMWVDAATFLPVTSVTGGGPYAPRIESTFTWLRATPRNRAVLAPEVPTGFQSVSILPPGLTTQAPTPGDSASP